MNVFICWTGLVFHVKTKGALQELGFGRVLGSVFCSSGSFVPSSRRNSQRNLVLGALAFPKAARMSRCWSAGAGAVPGAGSTQACSGIKSEEVQTAVWEI